MSVNKAILIGNLGRDPELRYTASGTAVATFSIATSERYKDRDGQQQEKTEWHNIVAWRQLAEICGKYLVKGKQVYIEGKIQTRSYEDRDGNKKYMTEIVADQMQMLSRSGDDQGGRGGYSAPAQNGSGSQPSGNQSSQQGSPKSGGFEEPPYNADDDIPF